MCLVQTLWPGAEVEHILQVEEPKWDLGKNMDVYEKAKSCEKIHSNGRQPKSVTEDRVFPQQ